MAKKERFKIYSIDDDYIKFLSKVDPDNVMFNKGRPYVGPVMEIDGVKWYVPLSDRKESDWAHDSDGDRTGPYPSSKFRMTITKKDAGIETPIGSVRLASAIPVPDSKLHPCVLPDVARSREGDLWDKKIGFLYRNFDKICSTIKDIYWKKKNLGGLYDPEYIPSYVKKGIHVQTIEGRYYEAMSYLVKGEPLPVEKEDIRRAMASKQQDIEWKQRHTNTKGPQAQTHKKDNSLG